MPAKRHMIDTIFILMLIAMFALFALVSVMIGANVYAKITASSDENYAARTSLLYLSEKLRQNGSAESVRIDHVATSDALVLRQTRGDIPVLTWIYVTNGELRELTMVDNGEVVDPQFGQSIMDLTALHLSMETSGLLRIETVDTDGIKNSVLFGLRQ